MQIPEILRFSILCPFGHFRRVSHNAIDIGYEYKTVRRNSVRNEIVYTMNINYLKSNTTALLCPK